MLQHKARLTNKLLEGYATTMRQDTSKHKLENANASLTERCVAHAQTVFMRLQQIFCL